jgi:hypothetical protein
MAATFRVWATAVAWTASKNIIDLWNPSGSAKTCNVYRIFVFNDGISAITGVMGYVGIFRYTGAPSGGTAIVPLRHRTNDTALDANTTAGTGRTITRVGQFRRFNWASNEIAAGTVNINFLETLVPFAEVWNSGYGDSSVEPIACRSGQNEGVVVGGDSALTAGSVAPEIEFTQV